MASPSSRLQTKPVITCLKTVLLIYSFIFWFTGVILLSVGVWGKVSLEVYFSLLNERATNVPYVLIGTGSVIILLGTFGCFATCRASTWMLKLYAMFLSVIFLVELIAAIVGFVFRHEIKDSFQTSFMKAMKSYNSTISDSESTSVVVDSIQRNIHCCGVQAYTDWEITDYYMQKGIPKSCCINTNNCTDADMKDKSKVQSKVFLKGCVLLVTSVMEKQIGVVAGISFGIACFQLIGIFLACCLSRYITNNQYEMV